MSDENKDVQPTENVNQENANEENGDQKSVVKGRRKLPLKIMIPAIIFLCLALGFGGYQMTPLKRASRVLAQGEGYLGNGDYEQALASFKNALEIASNDDGIKQSITDDLEAILAKAEEADGQLDYDTAIELAELVDGFGSDLGISDQAVFVKAKENKSSYVKRKEISGIIKKADEEFENGDYANAIKDYEEAKKKGADDAAVKPNLPLSQVYEDILNACKSNDAEKIAKLIDGTSFGEVDKALDSEGTLYIGKDEAIITKSDGAISVIHGELNKSTSNGKASAVISGANTYSLYEGEWNDNVPDGQGTLKVWNKRESIEEASVIAGTFAAGLSDGTEAYTNKDLSEIEISVNKGAVSVIEVDKQGNAVVYKKDGQAACGVKNAKVSNNTIDEYVAGVYGFGGSDEKLVINVLDSTPPVLNCNLKIASLLSYSADGKTYYYPDGIGYEKKSIIGVGISATDETDGDLTSEITNTSKRVATPDGYNENYKYGLEVIYTVSDAAGNTASMTVNYMLLDECLREWYVLSVKK